MGMSLAKEVAIICLSEDRPLHEELALFDPKGTRSAQIAAGQGNLLECLKALGFSRSEAKGCVDWPRASRLISQRLSRLPSLGQFYRSLLTVVALLFFMASFMFAVSVFFDEKVVGALNLIAEDYGAEFIWGPLASVHLIALLPVPFVGIGLGVLLQNVYPLKGWRFLRHEAQRASIASALVEKGAPLDVLMKWLPRDFQGPPSATDLANAALAYATRAERKMERFVVIARVGALFFYVNLTLVYVFPVYMLIPRAL